MIRIYCYAFHTGKVHMRSTDETKCICMPLTRRGKYVSYEQRKVHTPYAFSGRNQVYTYATDEARQGAWVSHGQRTTRSATAFYGRSKLHMRPMDEVVYVWQRPTKYIRDTKRIYKIRPGGVKM